MNSTLFVVTFADGSSPEELKQIIKDGLFGRFVRTEATEDPKVLHLWPSKNAYRVTRVQLVKLKEEGALSFVESPPADASICSSMKNELVVVTVKKMFTPEDVWQFCEDQFIGLCAIRELSDYPEMIYLWPTKDEYKALRAKLLELEEDGALTFVDSSRDGSKPS